MPKTLTKAIQEFIEDRYKTKREALNKEYEKSLAKTESGKNTEEIESQFSLKREKLQQDFTLTNWLDSAAKRASQISMATHAVKFTHSSAKGSNILACNLGQDSRYLDTAALQTPAIDAVGNAAALDVARLLQLTDEQGLSLLDYLKCDNMRPLEILAKDNKQLLSWVNGLKKALQDTTPSSHTLSKQIYFPIEDGKYHLLAPLYSSSLSQAIYQQVNHSRFSKEMVAAREARKNQRPHHNPVITYTNLAVTIAGGSKPQNVSQLNSGRGGRNYLLSTRPPQWKSQLKAPLHHTNIFAHTEVRYATRVQIKQLTDFLIKLNQKQTESNVRIRNYINRQVDAIIDQIFSKTGQWQQLPVGWSDEAIKLPQSQRRWLDPNNPKWDHHDNKWLEDIAKAFGLWLVESLKHYSKNELALGVTEESEWKTNFKQALWEMS